MAEIRDDHIKCDKTDPWFKIRMPERLIYWIDEAADYRGISTEELVNEFLYDHFGKTLNTKGEYKKLHAAEKKRRRQLTVNRYVARKNEQRNTGIKQMTPYFKNDVDWRAYEALRAENLKLLEEQDFETRRRITKHRSAGETEALRVALAAKGVDRNFIQLGDQKLWIRKKATKTKHGTLLKTKSKSKNGVFGFMPADVRESDALLQTILETAEEVGATESAARIKRYQEEVRGKDLVRKLKNPTK